MARRRDPMRWEASRRSRIWARGRSWRPAAARPVGAAAAPSERDPTMVWDERGVVVREEGP
eukprot:scaffold169406_cov24-Tisochrysis_lutea.AAC.3